MKLVYLKDSENHFQDTETSKPVHLFTLKTVQDLVSTTSTQVNHLTKKHLRQKKLVYTDDHPQRKDIYMMSRLHMLGTFNAQVRQTQAKQCLYIIRF